MNDSNPGGLVLARSNCMQNCKGPSSSANFRNAFVIGKFFLSSFELKHLHIQADTGLEGVWKGTEGWIEEGPGGFP